MWYRTSAPQVEQDRIPVDRRGSGFEEILQNLSEPEAQFEAKRCLSCGNCFECDGCYGACPEDAECDGCYGACPEDAIIKLGPGNRYKFDFDKCTGCAVCFEQCPCHAIEMMDEPAAEGITQ
jgi:ferredoxin